MSKPKPIFFIFLVSIISLMFSLTMDQFIDVTGTWEYLIFISTFIFSLSSSIGISITAVGLFSLKNSKTRNISLNTGLKTGILIPCYNENMKDVCRRIEEMQLSLISASEHYNRCDKYAFFILSDTQDNLVGVEENNIFNETKFSLKFPVSYRRRVNNSRRKVGNIDEWVDDIGKEYDLMIILDADSMVSGEWLLGTTEPFYKNPTLGLLQSMIYIEPNHSLISKVSSQVSLVCGQLYARGMTAWVGNNAQYWGHNATIRIEAYRKDGRLPFLKDGNTYLSHDVVEASYLSKAGWDVILDADAIESFEGVPPDLKSNDARDVRWLKGNLQHIHLLWKPEFTLTSKVHIASGLVHYLTAPVALLTILFYMIAIISHHVLKSSYIDAMFLVSIFINISIIPSIIIGIINKNIHYKQIFYCLLSMLINVVYWPIGVYAGSLVFIKAVFGKCSWHSQSRSLVTLNKEAVN